MNKITWVIFGAYFGVFVAVGVVFYYKYMAKFVASGAQPATVETKNTSGYIYFNQDNNLYRINPTLVYEPNTAQRTERYQSTGEVFHLDSSPNNEKIAYDSKNSQSSLEIWLVDLQSHESQIVATKGQQDLKDYQDFSRPKFSPLGTKLAFVAAKQDSATIFVKNLADGVLSELVIPANPKITDFTWTPDGLNIIYCINGSSQGGCWSQEIGKDQAKKIINGEVPQITSTSDGKIFYLLENQEKINIYLTDTNGSNTVAITDLVLPKKIVSFQIDKDGNSLTYEVSDNSLKDVYTSKIDGGNKIQLTTDGKSEEPCISPDGKTVAFLRLTDGIYTISVDKSNLQKITNITSFLKLLAWR